MAFFFPQHEFHIFKESHLVIYLFMVSAQPRGFHAAPLLVSRLKGLLWVAGPLIRGWAVSLGSPSVTPTWRCCPRRGFSTRDRAVCSARLLPPLSRPTSGCTWLCFSPDIQFLLRSYASYTFPNPPTKFTSSRLQPRHQLN